MECEGGFLWQRMEIRLGHPAHLRPGPAGQVGGEAGHPRQQQHQQYHHQQQQHQHQQQSRRSQKGPARQRRDAERAAAHRLVIQAKLEEQQQHDRETEELLLDDTGDPDGGLDSEGLGQDAAVAAVDTAANAVDIGGSAVDTAASAVPEEDSSRILVLGLGNNKDKKHQTRSTSRIIQLDGHSEIDSEQLSDLVKQRSEANRKIRGGRFCSCDCGCLWCQDGTGPTELGKDWEYPNSGVSLDIELCCKCHEN